MSQPTQSHSSSESVQISVSELVAEFRLKELQYKLEIEKMSDLVQNLRKEYTESLKKILENKENMERKVHLKEMNALASEVEKFKTQLQSLQIQTEQEKCAMNVEISRLKESEALLLLENVQLKKKNDDMSQAQSSKDIPQVPKSPLKGVPKSSEPIKIDPVIPSFPASNSPLTNSLRRSISVANPAPLVAEHESIDSTSPSSQNKLAPSASYVLHPTYPAAALSCSSTNLSSANFVAPRHHTPWTGAVYYNQPIAISPAPFPENMSRATHISQVGSSATQHHGLSRSMSYVGPPITSQPVYPYVAVQNIPRNSQTLATQQTRTLHSSSSLRSYPTSTPTSALHYQLK